MPVPRHRRRPQGRRRGQGGRRCSTQIENFETPCRADHRRHRRRLRQCRGDLSARQEDDRGRRLRAADREPGLRREAVRPPGRQGHRAARGLPREDPRLPLRLPRTRRRGRHHRHPHRLARRRPDQADRRHPTSRAISATSTTRFLDCEEIDAGDRAQRRRHHQPRRQADAAEAPASATCSSSAPAPARIAACSTASPRCRTAPTCCGSRPRSRISSRSPAWSIASARSCPNAKLVYNNSPSLQLDAELPPAGVRRLGRGRQGRLRL